MTTALLAHEMAKRHDVTVLTSQALNLPREIVENGVKIIRVPVLFRRKEAVANVLSMFVYVVRGMIIGRSLLGRNQYDVINTHFVLPTGPVGDALAAWSGIPNVLMVHGSDLYDPSRFISPHRHPLLRAWIRRLLRRADLVVGHSKNILDNMRRFYTPEIEGVRIPAMIQRPKVGAASRARYGCKEDDVLFVTVGRLVPRKGISQLISMMDRLRKEPVRLLILGTGPQGHLLKEETRRRQLEKQIVFMGQVEESEKFRILQMSDVFVSASQHEGFGLVFLEAMASGLPIICYDHGGQTDFLRDQETGCVVSLNNLEGFTRSCELFIRSPHLSQRIGENNKMRVEEFFLDQSALKYESVFSQVLSLRANSGLASSLSSARRSFP